MSRLRTKVKGSQQKGQGSKKLINGKHSTQGWQFSYVAHKTNECLYHIITMHMLNVNSKRIKVSCGDEIMEETHMKEKCEAKNDELVYKA